MNTEKIKVMISRVLLFLVILSLPVLNTTMFGGSAYAAQNSVITFDGSKYNKEVENLQYNLNILGYKDYDNMVLDVDGHFGDHTKSALDKFLKDQGFSYYSSQAEVKLMSLVKDALNKTGSASVSGNSLTTSTSPNDAISYDGSKYNGEAEYLQDCLNILGFKDSHNQVLDTDGYFGNNTKDALDKFMKSQGFSYFSNEAKVKLMSLAENAGAQKYNSGFTSGANKLAPTAFMYSSLSNIDGNDDPFYSMNVLKEFPYIITMKPTDLSYNSLRVAEVIKTQTKLFGYVNLGPNNPLDDESQWRMADLNKVKSEVDSIADAGWYGVFIDQFGYDWNETRERQNALVDYIHSKGLKCMANSWIPEDALDSKVDASANPNGIPSHLNSGDWYLVESFITDGDSYRGDASYIEKYLKIAQYKENTGINVAVLSYKRDSTDWQQASDDVKMSYILAQCLGYDGWWFGKTDNEDNLLYGKDPNIDIGTTLTKPLSHESGNLYTAEAEKYRIEYYAGVTPELKLIPKN